MTTVFAKWEIEITNPTISLLFAYFHISPRPVEKHGCF